MLIALLCSIGTFPALIQAEESEYDPPILVGQNEQSKNYEERIDQGMGLDIGLKLGGNLAWILGSHTKQVVSGMIVRDNHGMYNNIGASLLFRFAFSFIGIYHFSAQWGIYGELAFNNKGGGGYPVFSSDDIPIYGNTDPESYAGESKQNYVEIPVCALLSIKKVRLGFGGFVGFLTKHSIAYNIGSLPLNTISSHYNELVNRIQVGPIVKFMFPVMRIAMVDLFLEVNADLGLIKTWNIDKIHDIIDNPYKEADTQFPFTIRIQIGALIGL